MSRRSPIGYMTLLTLLASPLLIAARCDAPLSIGDDWKESAGASSTGDTGKIDPEECECPTPPPKSADQKCPDGSLVPLDCARNNKGLCDWIVQSCDGGKGGATGSTPEFGCADGTALHPSLFCNGKDECPDASDEVNCDTTAPFTCKNGAQIAPDLVCNGKDECPDGSDEVNCAPSPR